MRTLGYLLPGLAIMALAYWAYSENYRTQQSIREVKALQSEIGREREALAILHAEWAYLNRPERLRDLVLMNFDRLDLLPVTPAHFADVQEIPIPAPPLPTFDLMAGLVEEPGRPGRSLEIRP